MSVLNVTKSNFESVRLSEKTVLLDFFASWCMPCKMLSPIVDEIAEEHPEIVVGKINVDNEPELAERYGVVSIPTLVVMKHSEVTDTSVGARPKEMILSMLK